MKVHSFIDNTSSQQILDLEWTLDMEHRKKLDVQMVEAKNFEKGDSLQKAISMTEYISCCYLEVELKNKGDGLLPCSLCESLKKFKEHSKTLYSTSCNVCVLLL